MERKINSEQLHNLIKGGILGVICGDALGLPVQFLSREEVRKCPVTDMRGLGTFNLPAGSWSDDSSLTLASMDSIIHNDMDTEPMMKCFCEWLKNGKYTPYGCAYDIGRTCCMAIEKYMAGLQPEECGLTGDHDCGNGALMRIMPAALYLLSVHNWGIYNGRIPMIDTLNRITALTHAHPVALIASGYYMDIAGYLIENRFEKLWNSLTELVQGGVSQGYSDYRQIYCGSRKFRDEEQRTKWLAKFSRLSDIEKFKALPESEIRSSGYVVDTLEAAIWCLLNTNNYKDCVIKAANLGLDTDSVAAVAGGLAGLYYGYDSIPETWIRSLPRYEWILKMTEKFSDLLVYGRNRLTPDISIEEFTEAVRKYYEKGVGEELLESARAYFESNEAREEIRYRYYICNNIYRKMLCTRDQFLIGEASSVAHCLNLMWE